MNACGGKGNSDDSGGTTVNEYHRQSLLTHKIIIYGGGSGNKTPTSTGNEIILTPLKKIDP